MQSDTINKKRHVLYSIKYILKAPLSLLLSAVFIFGGVLFFCIFIQSYISGMLENGMDGSFISSLIAILFIGILLLIVGLLFWPRFPHVIILCENKIEFTNPHSKFLFPNLPLKMIPYTNIEKIDVDLYYQQFQVYLKEKFYSINPIIANCIPIDGIPSEKLKMIITILRKNGVQIDYPSR